MRCDFLSRNQVLDRATLVPLRLVPLVLPQPLALLLQPVPRVPLQPLEWSREQVCLPAMLKLAFNMVDDGMVGQQLFAGEATRLAHGTDEAVEGRDAFLEKRSFEFRKFPWHY